MGETLGNILAQLADSHNDFSLVIDASHVVGNKERLVILEH